jgi:signal transduction histidine kinase
MGRRMDSSVSGAPTPRLAAARLRQEVRFSNLIAACMAAAVAALRFEAAAVAAIRRPAGLRMLGFVAACLLMIANETRAGEPPQPRSVLVINQSTALRPWPTKIIAGIQASLRAHPIGSVSIDVEHLDLYTFDGPRYLPNLQTYFGEKYRNRPPAVIITIGPGALAATLKLRGALWPQTPVVFAAVDEKSAIAPLPPGVTGLTFRVTLASMIEAAKIVVPDFKAFAIVGNRLDEQLYYRNFADELPEYSAKYRFIDLMGLPIDQVRRRVAALPGDSVIFYLGINTGPAGAFASGAEALSLITAAANRPIVVEVETYLGSGAVGGFVQSPDRIGREAGVLALRILNGEDAAGIPVTVSDTLRPVFDWRALERWNISAAALPEGSELRFREPDVWQRYRLEIVSVTILIVLQAALIVGLLYEHRRRREAEALARSELAELAHMNRLATAGELSASIAHEVNQPLAGIVAYAEAGRNWLSRPTPDLTEAREKFEQIAHAGHRAAAVIDRIRVFFKKEAPRLEPIDVNELVRDVLLLVETDLRQRKVTVELALMEPLAPVNGDRVQLQQVILNLVVNAADAMDAVTGRERRLQVMSRREDDGRVRIDVQDSGSGIAVDDIDRVFAPFYTTKAKGMGMGLSISRSLIEAHGGTLKARRAEPFGMIFSFVLPTPRAAGGDDHRRDGAVQPNHAA